MSDDKQTTTLLGLPDGWTLLPKMKTMNDVTCKRCGCTTSGMWVDHEDLIASHVCPDGGRSESFTTATRIVPGPGERGKDDEVPR